MTEKTDDLLRPLKRQEIFQTVLVLADFIVACALAYIITMFTSRFIYYNHEQNIEPWGGGIGVIGSIFILDTKLSRDEEAPFWAFWRIAPTRNVSKWFAAPIFVYSFMLTVAFSAAEYVYQSRNPDSVKYVGYASIAFALYWLWSFDWKEYAQDAPRRLKVGSWSFVQNIAIAAVCACLAYLCWQQLTPKNPMVGFVLAGFGALLFGGLTVICVLRAVVSVVDAAFGQAPRRNTGLIDVYNERRHGKGRVKTGGEKTDLAGGSGQPPQTYAD